MKRSLQFLAILILLVLSHTRIEAQTNSVELKSGSGSLISSHNSVSAAVAAIPSTITQAYVIEITTAYTGANETFPISFPVKSGASASNTITLRPASGANVTMTASVTTTTTGLIEINDADYVIIDGRAGGTGTTNNLTINNTATAASATIMLLGGATNNIIRNCNLSHASSSSLGRSIGFSTSVGNNSGNSDNLVQFCKFTGGRANISFSGTTGILNTRNKIYGCEFVDNRAYGIYSATTTTGKIEVDSCSFYMLNSSTTAPSYIYLSSSVDTVIITRNKMYDVKTSSTGGADGIYISASNGNVTRIINNFISLNTPSNATTLNGIYLLGSGVTDTKVWFNTVRIGGTLSTGGTSGNVLSTAIYKTNSNASSTFDFRNNILVNERTGGTSGGQHLLLAFTNTNGSITMDYNTYNSTSGQFSRWGTTVSSSLTGHQSSFSSGVDLNSNEKPVNFISANDLHLTGTSLGDGDLKAQIILQVTNDIDNNPRGGSTYRGADDDPANPILGSKNEIGVVAINEPLYGTCATATDVKATVKNFGINQVDTFTVNWSINGTLQTPVTFYQLLDTVLGSGSVTQQVTLGNFAVTPGTLYTIKAWTSLPNNLTDADKTNDSTQKLYKSALAAGTYTIGGTSPDFATVSDAVNELNTYGICGPVVFDIRNGTYTEKLVFNEIPGASATNTITFKSESNNKTAVTISTAASASTTDNFTISLNGTDHITFRDLTLERSGTGTNSSVLYIEGNIENVVIRDNKFVGPTNITTDANGVRSHIFGAATTVTTNLSIFNNEMAGNSNGVWLNTNTITRSTGTKIYNNTIDANYTGIFIAGQNYPEIYKNKIVRADQTINVEYYGISLNIVDSAYFISQNFVESNRGYGIRLRDCNGNAGKEGQVINNMITMTYAGTSSVFGISNETSGSYQLFAHNTCQLDVDNTSTSTTTGGRGFYMPVVTLNAYSNVRILNNIFYNKLDGVAAWYTPNALAAIKELDYNLYYTTGENLGYVTSTYYPDFTSFQAATAKDAHSYNFAPTFVSSNNPHLLFLSRFAYGKNGLNINVDYDDDVRCASLPTIGADEYSPSLGIPTATFIGPSGAVTGDRSYFLFNGNANQIAIYKWYVNGVYVNQGINLVYSFPTAGNYDILMIAENCSGADSAQVSYTIADPVLAPTANFSSDRNQIYINESIKLTDLSLNGPTAWHWSVTPNNGTNVIFTDSTEQDPSILFTEAGKYEICLIADNAIGSSAQRCRTAYIEVYPIVNMCAEKTSTFERGKIYDDGGSSANYAANQNCAFFINPCASSLTLRFNQWTNTDADDRLIIYDGDTTDAANIIATITGGMTNPGGTTGFTAKTGHMWLVWKTDGTTQAAGFEAEWESVPVSTNPTVAGFNIPDTLYEDSPYDFVNTSTGNGLTFFWDFDFPNYEADNNNNYNKANPTKTFVLPGTYNVLLESTNCLGVDSFFKQIVVLAPTTAPKPVDFTASLTRVNTGEVTRLTDLSGHGPSSWRWEITPSNGVQFIDAATSRNPRVAFSFGGKYTIKLIAANSVGADSTEKIDYIEVVEYCRPNVLTTNTDVTIRRVKFEQIDQSSDYGVNKYSDFSSNGQVAQLAEGGTYNINIERNTNNERVNFAAWIDLNQDGDFEDQDERVFFDSASNAQILTAPVTIPASGLLGPTRLRVAVTRANLTTLPCGPVVVGEYEDYKVNILPDDKAPVITIVGPNPAVVEVGYSYTDSGATAFDNVDGNITSTIMIVGSADTLTVGEYTITYTSTDSRGNTTTVERKVKVTPDVTKPVFTKNGADTVKLSVFTQYIEPGFSAIDLPFGTNLTPAVITTGAIDTAKIGTYELTYTVADASGNTVQLKRVIIVSDTTKPVIVLNGNATIEHSGKTPYVDAGASVTDNYDAFVPYTVTGSVNVNALGTYTLVYKAVDASGNVADSVVRTITVVDKIAPQITLVGSDIVNIARWQSYTDSGYRLSDNFYDSAQVTVETLGNWVNSSVEGLYYIQYRATDPSGNVTLSAKRVIYVNGTNSVPVIEGGKVSVYPNPSNGNFTVEATQAFGQGVTITVTNLLGATVYQTQPESSATKALINLEGINAGIYFVNISNGNRVETTKIVVR
ncbi:DUF5011 domain-containing protein [Oscillatoria amoena NRMC-F 0135]|nr:DUF5011 domain-containing protein [Oscillatoria amoena NRMC-F 0135]